MNAEWSRPRAESVSPHLALDERKKRRDDVTVHVVAHVDRRQDNPAQKIFIRFEIIWETLPQKQLALRSFPGKPVLRG